MSPQVVFGDVKAAAVISLLLTKGAAGASVSFSNHMLFPVVKPVSRLTG